MLASTINNSPNTDKYGDQNNDKNERIRQK